MKKMMRAFTLAELLLCIGIIGIVSAMGMVITKHSTERAYNLYYYTGYINLYNAIADGKASGIDDIPGLMNHAGDLLSPENNVAFADKQFLMLAYSALIANGTDCLATIDNPDKCLKPKVPDLSNNGNSGGSEAEDGSSTEDGNGSGGNDGDNGGLKEGSFGSGANGDDGNGISYNYSYREDENHALITMSVPVAKTRGNDGRVSINFYFSNDNPGYLIPIAPAEGSIAPNLQVRRDLLPAYIDDGKVGRNNVVNRDDFNYAKPIYGTYKDAYCSIRGASGSIDNVISCADGTYTNIKRTENGTQLNGFLKIASPQKVH